MEILRPRFFLIVLSATLIVISSLLFQNPNNQGINWTFPYFSGAANFEQLFDWKISPSDYEIASNLSEQEYWRYNHQKTSDVIRETYNSYGYVLVAIASTRLFPFLGDLQSVILLQLIVHLSVSIFMVAYVLKSQFQRFGFLFIYSANPLVIYFVTFPYYYFWMFIPSICFIVWWTRSEWRIYSLAVSLPFLLLSLLIRPTTLFLCIFMYFAAIYFAASNGERLVALGSGLALILGIFLITGTGGRSPAHAMYVGLGAYPNNVGVQDLSDGEGYRFFHSKSGVTIDTNAVKGNFRDPVIRSQYMGTLMNRYKEIFIENPLLIFRNAVLNTLQTFSVGYDADRKWVNWLSSVTGLMVLTFLAYTHQWVWIMAVLSCAAGFAWYFPPIPAYNFGAYPLLVMGCLCGLELMISKWHDRDC